ncbi:MAG: HD domain-containing protein [Candidatus Latescibacteria bacterium]|nr:HD domain-containing protein [Candidatus Latescibacterota bacterium]OPX25097.1 MAG: hypothetical protein B1H02_02145 [Candidatus Latescibacteria bacterium 4484_107]
MAKKTVHELEPGQSFTSFFAVRKKEVKEYDGKPFLLLELGDRTGRIEAVIWERFPEITKGVAKRDVVKVQGTVITYRERPQISIKKIRRAEPSEYDASDFLPESERDRKAMYRCLLEKARGIKNAHLRTLLLRCFEDEAISEKLLEAPGGKLWHHAYLGGLLEHTLGVTALCERAAELYALADRDLLVAGALLHDIGKIVEYEWSTFFDYSDEGRLQGHIVLGEQIVRRKMETIEGFPEELWKQLSHILLSHQGRREFGSPVVPMMLEAIILYYADELDSKAGAFTRVIKKEGAEGNKWSSWVHLIERFIYLGPDADAHSRERTSE